MKIISCLLVFALSVWAYKDHKFAQLEQIVATKNEAAAKAYEIATALLLENRAFEAVKYPQKAIELKSLKRANPQAFKRL
ncbi:MAG: hypothetical protein LBO72_00905 [Helicobacteraceae bacterium]|jgi:hypothetical protein|nr:hypothetical protein [Helicobacteraceae bacterium]